MLSVLVAAGCGTAGTPPPDQAPGERVDTALVALIDKVHATPVGVVLDDHTEVLAFPGRFDAAVSTKLTEALQGRRADRDHPLVAVAHTVGCGGYGGAELHAVGSDLVLHPRDPKGAPAECDTPYEVVAVFAVPRHHISDDVTIDGEPPQSAGPGKLALFQKLAVGWRGRVPAADLAVETERSRFLAALPVAVADRVRAAAVADSPDARLFGFVLAGCTEETALLVVDRGSSSAYAVVAGGTVANCESAQYFVAVFTDDSPATRGMRPTDR